MNGPRIDNERHALNMDIALITMAIAHQENSTVAGAPLGPIYAELMGRMTLDRFNGVTGLLKDAGYATITNHAARLTDEGREVAEDLAKALGLEAN